MKCPLCESELEIKPHEIYSQFEDIMCPVKQGHSDANYYDTHYHRYPEGDWGYFAFVEQIDLYPFRITNYDMTYSEKSSTKNGITVVEPQRKVKYCSVKKFNPNRTTRGPLKELRPGYERVLQLPHFIHPDIEGKLRERLQLLLVFS